MYNCVIYFFFFSSRRRHTRYWRDWSSDVCSSDLVRRGGRLGQAFLETGDRALLRGRDLRGRRLPPTTSGVDAGSGRDGRLAPQGARRSEEHTSELQSRQYLVCRLLLEKKK